MRRLLSFPFLGRSSQRQRGELGTTSNQDSPLDGSTRRLDDDPLLAFAIPRECIHKSFEMRAGSCPRCGRSLEQKQQVYVVETWRGREQADSFVVSHDLGWFCRGCPTVVIDPQEVSNLLGHRLPHWDVGDEFALLGIVDLDAVPEEKAHLPFGEDDNPIPLVEFTKVTVIGRRVGPPKSVNGASAMNCDTLDRNSLLRYGLGLVFLSNSSTT